MDVVVMAGTYAGTIVEHTIQVFNTASVDLIAKYEAELIEQGLKAESSTYTVN